MEVNMRETEVSPISLRDVKKLKAKKVASHFLDLKKRCGIPNAFVYHFWNLLIIFDSLGHYIIYGTDLFGHYTMRKGLLSMYSVIYPSIAIAALYTWALIDRTDLTFKTLWVYKTQQFTLFGAIVCYAVDAILFIVDKHMFCTL